jgi:hypothetical protein
MVSTISTDRVSILRDLPTYVELGISFYPSSGDQKRGDQNQAPKLDVTVIMPEGWTPKMYVAALNKSIKRHSIISLELIAIDGRSYTTVNELQWLFSASNDVTDRELACSASYIRVSGGVLNSSVDLNNR